MKNKTKVWDFPTRLFHWLLAASLPFMWYSAKAAWRYAAMAHARRAARPFPARIPPLLGHLGQRYRPFLPFRPRLGRYTRLSEKRHSRTYPARTQPLGRTDGRCAFTAVSFQVGTGLFAADENTFSTNGYLNHLVSEHTGSLIRKIHLNFFKLLAVFSAVHIAAVAAYRIFKKKNLVRPMITGFKYIEGKTSIRFA